MQEPFREECNRRKHKVHKPGAGSVAAQRMEKHWGQMGSPLRRQGRAAEDRVCTGQHSETQIQAGAFSWTSQTLQSPQQLNLPSKVRVNTPESGPRILHSTLATVAGPDAVRREGND